MARVTSASPAPGGGEQGTARTTGRSTRSRSREPAAAAQASKTVNRKTRAGSNQRDLESSAIDGLQAMAQNASRGVARELEPVLEEPGQTIGILNDIRENGSGDDNRFRRRSSHDSRYSQRSRNTTFSQDEIKTFDVDAILDELSEFHQIAITILDGTAPPNAPHAELKQIANDLLDSQSKLRKRLERRLRNFDEIQQTFGQQTFVNPEHILRLLLQVPPGEELLSRSWRPDDIFYLTNLIGFLQVLFQQQDNVRRVEALEILDNRFPVIALSSLTPKGQYGQLVGESNLVPMTQALALELRTQLFINILQGATDREDTTAVLAQVFLRSDNPDQITDPSMLNADSLRMWDPILTETEPSAFNAGVLGRIFDLQQTLDRSGGDAALALSHLQTQHPWETFCVKALTWIQSRSNELQNHIDERGGVSLIVRSLKEEVASVAQGLGNNAAPSSRARGNAGSLGSSRNIDVLRARLQRASGQSAALDDMADAQPLPDAEPFEIAADENHATPTPEDQFLHLVDELRDTGEPAGGKENRRLIDPQVGADRVAWDTQNSGSSSHVSASAYPQTIQSASRKRTHQAYLEDDEFDPTQDDAFQTDDRPHPTPRRAARTTMTTGPTRSRVLPRTSAPRTYTQAPAQTRERQNPGQALEPLEAAFQFDDNGTPLSLTPVQSYKAINHAARTLTAGLRTTQPPRQRVKWSDDEVDALISYIGQYGPEYSHIIRVDGSQGNVFQGRTGEDLRFKARNMSMDYRKARAELPPGFSDVRLGKKELERLDSLGIEVLDQTPMRRTHHEA